MKGIKKKEENILFVCAIFVLVIGILFAERDYGLWIEDEFGYFGPPAYIAGFNWGDVYSGLGYYGFGYGILLIPAFFLCRTSKDIMTYSTGLNAVLLVGAFLLAVRITRKMFPQRNYCSCCLSAMAAVLCISNLAHIHMRWSEMFNIFLYWCILGVLYDVIITGKVKKYLLLAGIMCFAIMVHMRNIVIVFPCLLIILVNCIIKKKQLKKLAYFGMFIIIGMLFFLIIKRYIQINLYGVYDQNQTNDIGSTVNGIVHSINTERFSFLGKSFWAKLFYILSSSWLIFGYGIIGYINIYYRKYIKKDIIDYNVEIMFTASFLIAFCAFLFAVYMGAAVPSRMDVVFYGRYFESCIGMVLICGIMYITDNHHGKHIVSAIFFVLLLYKISYLNAEKFFVENLSNYTGYFTFPCIPGIAKYFDMGLEPQMIVKEIFLSTILRSIMLLLVILFIGSILKVTKNKVSVGLVGTCVSLCLIVFQILDAKLVVEQMSIYEKVRYTDVEAIADYLSFNWDTEEDDKLYYYHTEAYNSPDADILELQYLIGKTQINVVDCVTLDSSGNEKKYIILNKNEKKYEEYKEEISVLGFDNVCETNLFELYKVCGEVNR